MYKHIEEKSWSPFCGSMSRKTVLYLCVDSVAVMISRSCVTFCTVLDRQVPVLDRKKKSGLAS